MVLSPSLPPFISITTRIGGVDALATASDVITFASIGAIVMPAMPLMTERRFRI